MTAPRSAIATCVAEVRPRGFALVIVLWSLAMLALLGTELTATTRVQMRLAEATRDQAMAEAAADGAIRQAMFILLGGGRIGAAPQVRIGDASVSILAQDEAAKINPNGASEDVLRGLMVAVGVDQARAALLAAEIADWRTTAGISVLGGAKIELYREWGLPYRSADHVFYSVDEMGLLPDMTADVLARLRPFLSVYQEGDVNDPNGATPVAIASPSVGLGLVSRNVAMRVTAAAVIAGRARFVRSAVVRLRAGAMANPGRGGALVQILTWE